MRLNKKFIYLLIVLVLYSIFRLAIVFTSTDLANIEECYRYSLTLEIINGLRAPLLEYQYTPYEGVYIPNALFTVPFMMLFGTDYVVMKIQALFLSMIVMATYFFFLYKFFDKKLAFFTALLFIFSPFSYISRGLITMCHISTTEIFRIAILFLFYQIIYSNKNIYSKNNFKYFLLLGFVGGFGTWCSYTILIMLSFILLIWFTIDKRFFLRKAFFIFIVSFVVGFIPFIYYNLTHRFSGLAQFNQGFNGFFENLKFYVSKLFYFFIYDLPDLFNFKSFYFINGSFFNYLYYFIFLISLISLLIKYKKEIKRFFIRIFLSPKIKETIPKELPIILYPLFFLIFYTFSNYFVGPPKWTDGHRYLFPIYPFVFVIIAIFIYYSYNNRLKYKFNRIIPISLFSLIFLFGLISNFGLISFNNSNLSLENTILYKGCDHVIEEKIKIYNLSNVTILDNFFSDNINYSISKCTYEDIPSRDKCYDHYIIYLSEILPYNSNYFLEFNHSCSLLDSNSKNRCYKSLGEYVGWRSRYRYNPDKFSFDYCSKIETNFREDCRIGYIDAITKKNFIEFNEPVKYNKCEEIPISYRKICFENLIGQIKIYFSYNPSLLKQKCSYIPNNFNYMCNE